MIAIIFAKKSQRLVGKHNMDICGERLIERVSRIVIESHLFKETVLFTKDSSLISKYCRIEIDRTDGILIDSILYCLEKHKEFLAVGGDMPYIDYSLIDNIIKKYSGTPITYIAEGFYQPLFTVYNNKLYNPMNKYRAGGGESISEFLRTSAVETLNTGSEKLKSINYISDLEQARKILCANNTD